MKHIFTRMQGRFKQKQMTGVTLGAFVISILKLHSNEPDQFTGYVKNNKIVIKLPTGDDKTMRYMKKSTYLAEVNQKLVEMGYKETCTDLVLRFGNGNQKYYGGE